MSAGLAGRLRAGEPQLATFNLLPCPEVVELIALAGFDVVIVDLEHGPHDLADLRHALTAAASRGLPVLVRVRTGGAAEIGAVLDAGASGVLVPHVESAAAAARVVEAARFFPAGARGANPYVRAAGFGGRADWFGEADDDVAVLVMAEGRGALSELDEIVAVRGLDGVFAGPVDLSHALGLPGQTGHPDVVAAVRTAIATARRGGKAAGVFTADPASAGQWWGLGATLVATGVDTGFAFGALTGAVAAARALTSPGPR